MVYSVNSKAIYQYNCYIIIINIDIIDINNNIVIISIIIIIIIVIIIRCTAARRPRRCWRSARCRPPCSSRPPRPPRPWAPSINKKRSADGSWLIEIHLVPFLLINTRAPPPRAGARGISLHRLPVWAGWVVVILFYLNKIRLEQIWWGVATQSSAILKLKRTSPASRRGLDKRGFRERARNPDRLSHIAWSAHILPVREGWAVVIPFLKCSNSIFWWNSGQILEQRVNN